MNLVLSDCLSALKKVLSNNHVSPDYVEKYTQEFVNMLGKQYYEQACQEKNKLNTPLK